MTASHLVWDDAEPFAQVAFRLHCELRRQVVGEDLRWIERIGEPVTRVGPPLPRGFTRSGSHSSDQDEKAHLETLADHRCGKAGERLGDEYQIASAVYGFYHCVCVLRQAGGVVITRQVDVDDIMAELLEPRMPPLAFESETRSVRRRLIEDH